jgi:hypothetical protein
VTEEKCLKCRTIRKQSLQQTCPPLVAIPVNGTKPAPNMQKSNAGEGALRSYGKWREIRSSNNFDSFLDVAEK